MSAKLTKPTSDISLTNGSRSQASPLIRVLHHFALWRRRVRLVHFWIVSLPTHKRLLQEAKLTLNKCIDICWSSEATSAQLQAMGNQEDLKFVADDKIKKETQDKGGKPVISSKFCGKKHVRSREECPAWGNSCSKYGEKNHFAVKCTKSSKSSRPPKKKKKRKPVKLTVNESLDSVNSQKLYAKMVANGNNNNNNNNNLFAFPFEIRLQEIYIYFLFWSWYLVSVG